MRNPPVLRENYPAPSAPTEDEEAQLEAARHRCHASMLVREHLETHAANNPGASSDYVTWIATLHPENADVTIDQRFFVPGNPWWTIYEDTKNEQIPTATAVQLADSLDDGLEDQNRPSNILEANLTSSGIHGKQEIHWCKTCSPLSIIFAVLVFIPGLIAVCISEILALFFCYVPAKLFFNLAEACNPPNCCTWIFYYVFRICYFFCAFCDSIALVASVIGTEIIGLYAYAVGFCTGGALWASHLHQQVRRSCHGIRIFFRKNGAKSKPPRHFFGANLTTSESVGEERKGSRDNHTAHTVETINENGTEPVVSATVIGK